MMFRRLVIAAFATFAASVAVAQVSPDDPAAYSAPQPAQAKSKDKEGPVDHLRDEGISMRFVWANDWAASVRGGERLGATNGGGAGGGAGPGMEKLFRLNRAEKHIYFRPPV